MPIFISKLLEIKPTIIGPNEQPTSPPSASIENITVPPDLNNFPPSEYTPGQVTPRNNPQSEILISEITAIGDIAVIK